MRTEKRSSPQISGDMVLLHNMVSPQNGDTRGGPPPPSDATGLESVKLLLSSKCSIQVFAILKQSSSFR